ncbi:MAG: hypothetical protein ACK56F_31940, partial [bacterium]
MFLRTLIHDAWPSPRVVWGPSPRGREVRLLLGGGLDGHHLRFLFVIALAALLVLSARAVAA